MTAPNTFSGKNRRAGESLGRYVLGPRIGVGGAASVHLARLDGPHGFERLLAIKIVHEHLLEDKDFIAMFLDEANLTVRLSHPNIIHTYELGRQGDVLFLAMEYLRGKPLSLAYQRAFERGAPIEYDLVAWLGARCADALHYAHGLKDEQGRSLNVVHRDISPDNLFITYEGEVKVIDFGIARAEGRLAKTEIGSIKGKFRYMSPEYALGRTFDHTLDLFALGASLYEAALGQAAFAGADALRTVERLVLGDVVDPLTLRPDFPPEFARILTRVMSSSPASRYESGSELAHDLDRVAGLTLTEARARLAHRMHTLFGQEMVTESAVVTEVRKLRPRSSSEPPPPPPHELERRPDPRPLPRWLLPAIGTGGGIALAVALFSWMPAAPNASSLKTAEAPPVASVSPSAQPSGAPPTTSELASGALSASANPTPPLATNELASGAPSASANPTLPPTPPAATRRSTSRHEEHADTSGHPEAESTANALRSPADDRPAREPTGVIRDNPFGVDH